jgi:hypothetical protein
MKTLFTIIGAALLAMGVLWACQGAGVIRWPAESFMIDARQWISYGAGTALTELRLTSWPAAIFWMVAKTPAWC